MPIAAYSSMRNAARGMAVALAVCCGAGCSIRYDAAGVTRTGVGLWGLGDPPGVNWNLDWPRRDVPELPASRHPELPPRAVEPAWQTRDDRTIAPHLCAPIRLESAIGDNRDCASHSPSEAARPLAIRTLDRRLMPDRG